MRWLFPLLLLTALAPWAAGRLQLVEVPLLRLPTAADAYALALADCQAQPPASWPYLRWVWITPEAVGADAEGAKALSLGVNIVSRATTIRQPVLLGRGQLMVARLDLRLYAPRDKDLREWLHVWEDFQFSPRLSLLITKGGLRFAQEQLPDFAGKGMVIRWAQSKASGEWYRTRRVEAFRLAALKDVELIRLPAPHLDPKIVEELCHRTGSQAPLVPHDYFLTRALTTIKDRGLYAILYGGRYYELAGIGSGFKKGTDEDNLFEQLGVGNVEKKVTAEVIFERLRSDLRTATFRSKVTRHQRRIDFLPILSGRLDQSTRLAAITHDLRDQDIDVDVQPTGNLLESVDQAREMIYTRANGTRGYALFNGKGARQDEVPPDVAIDGTIQVDGPKRLQPGLSCIACHEGEGSDGWKVPHNSVKALLGRGVGLNAFGDLGRLNQRLDDTRDRIDGLYRGDPEHALARARDDYAAAVLRATGPWKASKKGQADVVRLAAERIVGTCRDYTLAGVDARKALLELGVEVSDPKADVLAAFATLIPPEVRAARPIPEIGEAVVPESVTVAGLRAGEVVNRSDFDLQYGWVAGRLVRALAALPAKEEAKK